MTRVWSLHSTRPATRNACLFLTLTVVFAIGPAPMAQQPSPTPAGGVEQLQAIAALEAILPDEPDPAEIRKLDDLYQAYLRQHPSDARGYSLHGAFLSSSRQPKRAMVQFQRAIKLQPEVTEYHLQYASASMLAGDTVRAIQAYRAAVAISPDNAQLHADLATHLSLFRRDLVEASVDPSESAVLDQALAHYAKAASLAPTNAELWRAYAETFQYFPAPDLAAAAKAWEAYLALTPHKDFARLQLARVAIQRRDRQGADVHLAAIQDPAFFDVRDKLAKKAEALVNTLPAAP